MEWPAAYALDEATGIRVRGGRQVAHDYTDGTAAEAYILDAIQTCRDVSSGSDELVQRIRDWPSEYHFSASRPTLLAPFDLQGLSVLEVGCGCGALTRYLGESGARVVALEGSLDRARITAARCRGLDVRHHFPAPLIGTLKFECDASGDAEHPGMKGLRLFQLGQGEKRANE